MSRGAGDFAAGVGAGTAKIEAFDRGAIAGKLAVGSLCQHLRRDQVDVSYVAVGKVDTSLKVGRCEQLPIDNGVRQVRRIIPP